MGKNKIPIIIISVIIVAVAAFFATNYYYKAVAGKAALLSIEQGVGSLVQELGSVNCGVNTNKGQCEADANCDWFGKCFVNIGTLQYSGFNLVLVGDTLSCNSSNPFNQYALNSVDLTDRTGTQIHQDSQCLGETKLRQYACMKNIPASIIKNISTGLINQLYDPSLHGEFGAIFDYKCPNGCANGACIQISNQTQPPINQTCDYSYCESTDSGDNIYVAGNESYYNLLNNTCTKITMADYCIDEKTLWEYNCRAGGVRNCPNGCKDGACNVINQTNQTQSGYLNGKVSLVSFPYLGIPYANVTITGPVTFKTVTLCDGAYLKADVPAGNYTVTATKSGYTNTTTSVQVTGGMTATANLFVGGPRPQPCGNQTQNVSQNYMNISSSPSGAQIYYRMPPNDWTDAGLTPMNLLVTNGTYELNISYNATARNFSQVSLAPWQNITLYYNFKGNST